MFATVLQAQGGYVDDLLAGDVFRALIGPFVDVLGIPLAALIFFGAIGTAYYAVSGRATMPAIMTMLIGGVTLRYAPPAVGRLAIIVLVLAIVSTAYLGYQRAATSS
jgi:hypothetical protein